tara:strand:- start:302 stop:811 length:510 start_codon:yes stop_codon:yes gene_type:complete
MATGDIKGVLAASSQLTITLASLATDANLLTGSESTEFDNTTTLYPNISVTGKITVGTSPTTAKEIRVYLVRPMKDGTYPDVFDGTGSAETISSVGTRESCCKLIARIDTVATSDLTYYFDSGNIAAIFGFDIISKFVVFVTHSTAVNLNSTAGNHEITVKGTYENVAP